MDDLLQNAPCGFLTFDDTGQILTTNITLAEMLGYAVGELEHRLLSDVLTVGARIFYQTHFFPLLKLHGKAEEIYLDLKAKNGQKLPVFVNAARRVRNGVLVNDCVFVVVHQRTQYEDALLAARKAADQAMLGKTKAFEELNEAHAKLEEQAVELEAQTIELEVQQEELLHLNAVLEEDLRVRKAMEEQLRGLVTRETLINNIGKAIRESASAEAIQQTATTGLSEALGTDRCFFIQYDTMHDRFWVDLDWRSPGLPSLAGSYRPSTLDMDLSLLCTPEAPCVVTDTQDPSTPAYAARALRDTGLRSAIAVGLFDQKQLVAVLAVGMARRSREWTPADIALVQAVAVQVRSAMEAARVRQREHNIAHWLQEALLPSSPAPVPGLSINTYYRPALGEAEIGGDFFDVFPTAPGEYAIVVADVSGKGLAAAAQIASVRHMLRALLYQHSTSLADAVTSLNTMLADHDLLSGFATLFVGLYDIGSRSLLYVSCGQEPGLVRRAGTGAVEYLPPTGAVLGGIGNVRFTQNTVQLLPNDVFALFTDGLTEAGLLRTHMLGIDGVEEIFRAGTENPAATPHQITSAMMERVLERVTPAGLRDDVCLLAARVNSISVD